MCLGEHLLRHVTIKDPLGSRALFHNLSYNWKNSVLHHRGGKKQLLLPQLLFFFPYKHASRPHKRKWHVEPVSARESENRRHFLLALGHRGHAQPGGKLPAQNKRDLGAVGRERARRAWFQSHQDSTLERICGNPFPLLGGALDILSRSHQLLLS